MPCAGRDFFLDRGYLRLGLGDGGFQSVGEGWLMGAILGKTSLRDGQGSIVGTVLGALPLTALTNGIVLINVSGFRQRVIVGTAVLIAVLVDLWCRRSN